jgi:DNA-directed RNA polymerase specialized sigma24 family protein
MRQALEAPLFERALAGEERAVADVARQARAVARRALRRYFRCSQDVEDGAQEAVVRAITHLAQLRDIATFES